MTIPKWMRLQFGLRTLIALVSIACGLLTWLGVEYRRANSEWLAVSGVLRTGGEVFYDVGWPHNNSIGSDQSVRRRLRSMFGDTLFGSVREVRFGAATTLSDIRMLDKFSLLNVVAFARVNLTSNHIKELSKETTWKRLYLFDCNINPDTYAELGNLPQIESLWIVPPTVRKLPLNFLHNLVNLKDLWIDAAVVDIGEIEQLVVSRNIESLRFLNASIVSGMGKLPKFINLRELNLSGTNVPVDELTGLSTLRNLKTLWLMDTNIGDENLAQIEQLKQLELLELSDTQVTSLGAERLRTALPRCVINRTFAKR